MENNSHNSSIEASPLAQHLRRVDAELPTNVGQFRIRIFPEIEMEAEHVALVHGDLAASGPVLVRIHSQCMTGDVFGSQRCDCGGQLQTAMEQIVESGAGVILYMHQEGRGIGLWNKVRAYNLQDTGINTGDANTMLGFPRDARNYDVAAKMLRALGVRQVRLLTNNPEKIAAMESHGFEVVRESIEIESNAFNNAYLAYKRVEFGHLLDRVPGDPRPLNGAPEISHHTGPEQGLPSANKSNDPGFAPVDSILDTIGHSAVVKLNRVQSGAAVLAAKLEANNPGGSAKDRPARLIIEQALRDGMITPGATVVESTSGNMGVGLAQACCIYGIQLLCVVDPRTPVLTRRLMEAYGARVESVEHPHSETGDYLDARLDRVKQLLQQYPDYVWLDQYTSQYNPYAHELGTGAEIARTIAGYAEARVYCAVSTGGTLLGIHRALQDIAHASVVAVESVGSAAFGGERGPRVIPGFGSSRPSAFLTNTAIDRLPVVQVSGLDCIRGCRELARREGIITGGSGGGVFHAASAAAKQMGRGSIVIAVLADGGARYLETIFNDQWVHEQFGEQAKASIQA